jgi:23S rRNA pseudouridine2605 synthase
VNNNIPSKSSPQSQRKKPTLPPKAVKAEPVVETQPERIQKVLARGGLGSRREIERWIEEQRLTINGKPVSLGQALKTGDYLELNGRVVHWEKFTQQPTQVLIYNKPVGEVVTRRDPEGRPTIFSRLPKLDVGRWIAVGRLDINTSGLLLVTNNGELANRLMHPSTQIEREYAVRILGDVPDSAIEQLKAGVELEDGMASFSDIQFFAGEGANKWYHVVVSEGRNRLVRRLWESQQLVVSRLMRVRYGPIMLPEKVRANHIYELNHRELSVLLEFAGLAAEKPPSRVEQIEAAKIAAKPTARKQGIHTKSNYKGGTSDKVVISDWTYKADAEEQAHPKKFPDKRKGQAGKDQPPKRPRFNGKKSR